MKTIKRGKLSKKWNWIARDKNGSLYLYERKPTYTQYGFWYGLGNQELITNEENLFADIKWTDDEPTKIED